MPEGYWSRAVCTWTNLRVSKLETVIVKPSARARAACTLRRRHAEHDVIVLDRHRFSALAVQRDFVNVAPTPPFEPPRDSRRPLPLPTVMRFRIPDGFSGLADGWDNAPGLCW
jgi:hypothetical protein